MVVVAVVGVPKPLADVEPGELFAFSDRDASAYGLKARDKGGHNSVVIVHRVGAEGPDQLVQGRHELCGILGDEVDQAAW